MSERGLVGLVLAVGVLAADCAPALRKPPDFATLTGAGPTHRPEEVDALLARAQELFGRRDVRSVHEAVATWLSAASADPSRAEGLEGAARGSVFLAERETEPARRREAASAAVADAQLCLEVRPGSGPCLYWLGAALGLQAKERPSTGLSALPKIADAFARAAAADPLFDDAGPDRALALFYVRAPGWPTGPGDPDRALTHARRAVLLRPEHAPNHLALAESLRATGAIEASRDSYRRALELAELDPSEEGKARAQEASAALEQLERR